METILFKVEERIQVLVFYKDSLMDGPTGIPRNDIYWRQEVGVGLVQEPPHTGS